MSSSGDELDARVLRLVMQYLSERGHAAALHELEKRSEITFAEELCEDWVVILAGGWLCVLTCLRMQCWQCGHSPRAGYASSPLMAYF